jgi:HEAT repeat protein
MLTGAIDKLGNLDYATRTEASRIVRRTAAEPAVTALVRAALEHADGYVRYKALVLLSGFDDPRGRDVMKQVLGDPNDRLREVAYNYFSHHPDESVIPALLKGVEKEHSEFVRPALMRALAAHGSDARVRERLLVEVNRGQDYFRSAVIEALGDFKAVYAVTTLSAVARLDGPLQDDAALALGRLGDKRALEVLASLQRSAPRTTQPALAAAICLLGVNCSSHQNYIEETVRFAAANASFQDLLRSSSSALSALADAGNAQALATLFDVGIPSTDPARAPIALAIGAAALRNTPLLLSVLQKRSDRPAALSLLAESFDMLEEDYDEERFFAFIRHTYWKSPEGSPTRDIAGALIEKLEF